LDIFQKALEENNETSKNGQLYEETIDINEKKIKFSLPATLFLKAYEKIKDLHLIDGCIWKINEKEKIDKNKDFVGHLETFKKIYSNSNDIEQKNGYDPIKF